MSRAAAHESVTAHLLRGASRAAWSSVVWPLEAWARAPDHEARLLEELAGGLGRALRGRRVGLDLGGRRLRAVLESAWLDRRDGRHAGRLQLRDVDYDGLAIERLTVVADAVALFTSPDVELVASAVELRGHAALPAVVVWLDGRLPGWSLRVVEAERIEASAHGRPGRLLVDGAVRDGVLEVELRAVLWRGLTLRCPRWLRLTRVVALAALPEGAAIAEARRVGARVEFCVTAPGWRRSLDRAWLRRAAGV